MATGPPVAGRVRSKTFEEYERDTTDAWDEEEREDISRLSVPAELENELKQQQAAGASSDSAAAPPRRREGRGKGVCVCVCVCVGGGGNPNGLNQSLMT